MTRTETARPFRRPLAAAAAGATLASLLVAACGGGSPTPDAPNPRHPWGCTPNPRHPWGYPHPSRPCSPFSAPESFPMTRNKFHVLLVLAALSIIVGGMACGDTQEELDKIDETYGATG